jgi:hypothetical protein
VISSGEALRIEVKRKPECKMMIAGVQDDPFSDDDGGADTPPLSGCSLRVLLICMPCTAGVLCTVGT